MPKLLKSPAVALSTLAAAGALLCAPAAQAAIDIVFDYTYDSNGFFSAAERQTVLELAASDIEARLTDEFFAELAPTGPNTLELVFANPGDFFAANVSLDVTLLPADTLRIYVGGSDLSSIGALGVASTGYSYGGFSSWVNQVEARLSTTNYDSLGGSITFDTGTSWYFGTSEAGQPFSSWDFYSVAVHEIFHILGFGGSAAFDADVSAGQLVGASVQAVAGGPVALAGDDSHWAQSTLYQGDTPVMVPALVNGQRNAATELDYAALADIGYTVSAVPEPAQWLLLLAGGLPLLLARARRAA